MSNQPGFDWLTDLCETPAPIRETPIMTTPPPAPVKPGERHFYRCAGCLAIVALDGPRLPMDYNGTIATCAVCGQHFEHMGRVQRDRLVTERLACKCDDRCTSARGPLCVCACSGKHHGAGMIGGYHIVTTDQGPVPQITPASRSASTAKAQYREYSDLRDRLRRELDALLDRRQREGYLPRPDFDRLTQLQHANRAATKAKTHASRMGKLRGALGLTA